MMTKKQPERYFFRPHHEPAIRFYDSILKEAKLRKEREGLEWIEMELKRMHQEAATYAKENNLVAPTLDDIKRAEAYACGHTGYAAKWAYKVTQFFEDQKPS